MNHINKVEISFYRSFYKAVIPELSNLNIISGKNDSGKSNIGFNGFKPTLDLIKKLNKVV